MDLSISVCIPCIEKHIPLLARCVGSIYRQIILPKEVIISISSVKDIANTESEVENLIGKFRKRLYIKVLYTEEAKYAGENRNKAIVESTGDLISFIDADDTMYTNRLYVIKRIFLQDEDCLGLLHFFTENDDLRNEKWNFDKTCVIDYMYSNQIHFGHPTFRRQVFSELKYSSMPRMQDIKLVEYMLPKYRGNLRIYKKRLTNYNSNNSTFY